MLKLFKPLAVVVWTVACYYILRWVFYRYWTLDILDAASWYEVMYVWEIGKVFPWMFVFVVTFALPAWIAGIAAIVKIDFVKTLDALLKLPLKINKRKHRQNLAKKPLKIKKKKSYVDIRPPALKPVMGEAFQTNPRKSAEEATLQIDREREERDDFYDSREDRRSSSSLGAYDTSARYLPEPTDEPDFMDPSFGPKPFDNRGETYSENETAANISEIIENAGYKVLKGIKAGKHKIDFAAVSNSATIICFEEKQKGDWLADEERFNDDEPLWFSESAQRVSPAYTALNVRNKVYDAIAEVLPEMIVVPVLIVSNGTIINAADMLDTWEEMQIFVGRIGEGGPADLKKLSKLIPQNPDSSVDDDILDKVEKAIKAVK